MSGEKIGLKLLDGILMPFRFYEIDIFRDAVNYKPQYGDLFISSYPKSGTTWTQYIVWEIMNDGIEPPYVNEMWYKYGAQIEAKGPEFLDRIVGPPPRNPWDVCPSQFRDIKRNADAFGFENGEFSQFLDLFLDGETPWGDYFDHIYSWYQQKSNENILFLTYEELKCDIRSNIIKIAKFMGDDYYKKLENDNQLINNIILHTNFEYMKKLPLIQHTNNDALKKSELWGIGKNLDAVKTGDYKLVNFFNIGKSGYARNELYTEVERDKMMIKIKEEFPKMPQLIHTWNLCQINIF